MLELCKRYVQKFDLQLIWEALKLKLTLFAVLMKSKKYTLVIRIKVMKSFRSVFWSYVSLNWNP